MKKERWIWLLLLLSILLLSGCAGKEEPIPSEIPTATIAPTESPITQTEPEITEAPETEAPATEAPATEPVETQPPETEVPQTEPVPEETEAPEEPSGDRTAIDDAHIIYVAYSYAQPLSRYHTALTEQWGETTYLNHEMSSLGAFYYDGDPLENVGFALLDLDGDESYELIIGAILHADVDPTIFEIWTLVDNVPVKILESHARDRYFLEYDESKGQYLIANDASNGSANFANYYYRIENCALVLEEGIIFDATANSESPWFYTTDEDWDPSNDRETDSESAMAITDRHRSQVIVLPFYPFALY